MTAGASKVAQGPCWRLHRDDGRTHVILSGDWIAQSGLVRAFPAHGLTDASGHALDFDTTGLGHWDSSLIAFLWDVKLASAAADIAIDVATLPDSARKLLGLLPDTVPPQPQPPVHHVRPLDWLGGQTFGLLTEIGSVCLLLATTVKAGVMALRGRARVRAVDIFANVRDAGPSALIIVSVVNFLIGAILAFVGASQLSRFAAGAYVANLVGIALVREMAAVMTAIVMAGRTGGAYAARIATMQGNEEIDALAVVGIPVTDYILLPSILALVLTMPFLYLYGCLVGMFGGFVVALAMLNTSAAGYLHQTLGAVKLDLFVFGFLKSIAFAVFIGLTSCRIGLKAGRSAADVGQAATKAVVVGIVGVIAMDAVFAVFAEVLGL